MPEIKFGLNVNMHPEVAGTSGDQVFRDMIEYALVAEDLGWDGVFAGQHYLSGSVIHLQPLVVMSYLAARTSHVDIGPMIALAALTNPVDLAEHYATLDAGSGGRLILGLGIGYREEEFDAFGVARPDRVRRFRENVRIIDGLLRHEVVNSENEWCILRDQQLTFPTVQRPRPPIWMAGNNDKGVQRAARLADAWMIPPHTTAPTIARQLELYRAERDKHGLPQPSMLPGIREVYCTLNPNSDVAQRAARSLEGKYAKYHDWGQDASGVQPEGEEFDKPYDQLAENRFAVGDPDVCFAALKSWIEMGVTYPVIRTHWAGMEMKDAIDSIKALTDHVIPELRKLAG